LCFVTAFAAPPVRADVTVSGPPVTVTIAGATTVTLAYPPAPGNFSEAVLTVQIVADASATGCEFTPLIDGFSANGWFKFESSTHVEGPATWLFTRKKNVKALQGGSVVVELAPYIPQGQVIAVTLTPTATFSK